MHERIVFRFKETWCGFKYKGFLYHPSACGPISLIPSLAMDASTIYFNQPDAAVVQSPSTWIESDSFARTHGFPDDEYNKAIEIIQAKDTVPGSTWILQS